MISEPPGFVNYAPRRLLQAEGLFVAAASILAFSRSGASWWFFAALILAPDLSILFYLFGARLGAFAYNTVHVYLGPLLLLGHATLSGSPTALAIALIWSAHIGIDRALGFGLKYRDGFRSTHLGRIGG
ncbi:MAG TPA: DUF4260 domain-containing protein [Methylocella sp.]|nr:DUF4260 domain-containing protein [Methylocella sp.]